MKVFHPYEDGPMKSDAPGENAWLGAVLHHLGVHKIEATLSGGGDSGAIDDVTYLDASGQPMDSAKVEDFLLSQVLADGSENPATFQSCLYLMIESAAEDLGNYYDNEGGSVWLLYTVQARSLEQTEGVFTAGEYEDEEYDGEYAEEEDPDLEDADPAP
jgi:hypothetical protein